MSLLKYLSSTAKSPEELFRDAEARLDATDALIATSPRKAAIALSAFDKTALEPFVDFGTELYEPFAECVLAVCAAIERTQGGGEYPVLAEDLPPVLVYTDPEPGKWSAIVAAAKKSPEGASYIRYAHQFGGHAIVAPAVAALRMLVRDRSIQAVFPGEGYALLRNDFLVALAKHWPSEVSEERWDREFGGIATGALGCQEVDGEYTPIGFEVMVYRAKQ